jgi:hypothetical protein
VFTAGVEDAPGDDDAVSAVLIEESIDLEVERMSRDIRDDLVDTDALAATAMTPTGAPETHHENRVARDRAQVDLATERHRDARVQPPAVERVDNVEVVAVGGLQGAVGIRMCETPAGVVAGVLDGEDVGGKGPALRSAEIEQREHVLVRRYGGFRDDSWIVGGQSQHQDRALEHGFLRRSRTQNRRLSRGPQAAKRRTCGRAA